MKNSYLINFDLFCQRRKFSIKGWIEKNPDKTYKDFCELLVQAGVNPPPVEVFSQHVPEVKEEVKVISVEPKDEITEVATEEPAKPVKKRRRRKKSD